MRSKKADNLVGNPLDMPIRIAMAVPGRILRYRT